MFTQEERKVISLTFSVAKTFIGLIKYKRIILYFNIYYINVKLGVWLKWIKCGTSY